MSSNTNFVQLKLAAAATAAQTTLTVTVPTAPFQLPAANGTLTLLDVPAAPTKAEIVSYTTVTNNGNGTATLGGVTRGKEGTTAQAWPINSFLFQSLTAADYAADLAAKQDSIAAGTTAQFWRGDKTWQDLGNTVRAIALTGIVLTTNAAITASDTILSALGKLQKQITDLGSSKLDASSFTFANLGSKPTTLAGYGITDAAAAGHTHSYLPLAGGVMTAVVEEPFGIHGGYGGTNGSGANWGANIWGMGASYDGSGQGTAYDTAGHYGLVWLRGSHVNANAAIGEGLYVYQNGVLQAGVGANGIWTDGALTYGSITLGSDTVSIDTITGNGVITNVTANTTGTFNGFQPKNGVIVTYNDGTNRTQIHYTNNGMIWSRSKAGANAYSDWRFSVLNDSASLSAGSCTFNGNGAITMLRNTANLAVGRDSAGVYSISGVFGTMATNMPAVAMTNAGGRVNMTQGGNGTNLKLTVYGYNNATPSDTTYLNVILGN